MAGTYQLILDGTATDEDFRTKIVSLEVEESVDLPGAVSLKLRVTATGDGGLSFVDDPSMQPFKSIAVVASQDGAEDACIFDGLMLSHKLHLQTAGISSELQVWGQDSSWLMNLEEKVKEWLDVTDADVAAAIFSDYGITPSEANSEDDSPTHTEAGHSLMQRGTDIQFLRQLARRNGKLCRVGCTSKPGDRLGYFARPSVEGEASVTLVLDGKAADNLGALDFEWDVTRPSAVKARQALLNDDDPDGASADTDDSGLAPLDDRTLADFATKPISVMLAAPVDDAGELKLRAQALLREAGWFARCEGEAEADRVGAVLRAGTIVSVEGAGSLNSGKYFVWSVRHTFMGDSHKMRFVLVRNAVGAAPGGGAAAGLLGGLL